MNNNNIALSELSCRDKVWDIHKQNAIRISSLYSSGGNKKYALRIYLCAKQLEFITETCGNSGELKFKLKTAKFCRIKLCPVCQWRRSLMWKARAYQALPRLRKDYPKLKYIFLTLTVKNCEVHKLRDTIDWLNYSWVKLTKRKRFPAVGWIKSLEVTINKKEGTVHPHIHALLAVKTTYFGRGYISQKEWEKLWQKVTKVSYQPVIDVRKVSDVESSIPEIFAYTTKESDYVNSSVPFFIELSSQLHKTRLVSIGGILRDYFASVEEDDTDLVGQDEDDNNALSKETFSFSWDSSHEQYIANM